MNKLKHVALIMDGNRRWAKERGLPVFAGHRRGYKKIETIINYAVKKDIKYVTFWAFSTENWKRDKKEISFLMDIFRKAFTSKNMKKMMGKGVKIHVLGDLAPFPADIVANIHQVLEDSKDNTKIQVNIALNYGGRAEILRVVANLLQDKPKEVTEELFSQYLYTIGQPDPDLIIRTGGEMRLSGYLPWQTVYSELYFTQLYWPDFDEKEFEKAITEYYMRERRFGK